MSYNEWLESQSTEFQDAVLGSKRGAEYRTGQYKADRYREYGKPLSLDQLNKTDDLCLRGNDELKRND